MFKFISLGLEIIEIIIILGVGAFCFYLFFEFVFPFFTFGAVKPGWIFFSKYQEKKAAKKAAEAYAKSSRPESVSEKPAPEVEITEESASANEGDTGNPPTKE